jgi:ribosome-binding protein aMBF1 (putative translation factor)
MSKYTDYQPNVASMAPARKEPDTSTYAGRFAVHIRKLRKEAGLSVKELAEQSGIPPTTIYNWESTIAAPMLDQLPKLAAGLGLEDAQKILPKE